MDLGKFRDTFIDEAQEYLDAIEKGLLELERNTGNRQAINDIFRAMHSLKGNGGMFGFENLSAFTHDLETLYDLIREGRHAFTEEIASATLQSVDIIKTMLQRDDEPAAMDQFESLWKQIKEMAGAGDRQQQYGKAAKAGLRKYRIQFIPDEDILQNGANPLYMLDELAELGEIAVIADTADLPELEMMHPEKCYLRWEAELKTAASEAEIKDVFLFVEDEAQINIELQQEDIPTGVPDESATFIPDVTPGMHSIKVDSDRIDMLNNLVGELVTYDSRLSMLSEQLADPELTMLGEQMKKLIDQLKELTFEISLVPLEAVTLRFERLVRDIALEQGRKIIFKTEGAGTQLDKTIIEHLIDPVMHILRNSISHGIEPADERLAKGKSAEGNVLLKAWYSGANVRIDISDDGRGFDTEKIRRKAVAQGLISSDEPMSREDILALTFRAGFSTAGDVSDLSGRGVGMDVIRKNLEAVHGEVMIDSTAGRGSVISLIIPLTLSIVDGLLVTSGKSKIIIPAAMVERVDSVSADVLLNGSRIHSFQKESIPLIPVFFIPDETMRGKALPVVIVSSDNKKYGLVVNELSGKYQTVLKPLGNYLEMKDEFSGGSVLGDGSVAFVLDVRKFLKYRREDLKTQYKEKK